MRAERFTAAEQSAPVRDLPFEVELRRTGRTVTVTVTSDVSVLDAVRRAGADVLSSCEQGTCGTCLTPVLEGRPDHRDSILAAGDPLVQVPALTVVHEFGERADMDGGAVECGAVGQDCFELPGLVVGATVGVAG